MKVDWKTSDNVFIEMDALDYHLILDFLVLLEVAFPRASKALVRFEAIRDALYNGMEGRSDLKQVERKEEK